MIRCSSLAFAFLLLGLVVSAEPPRAVPDGTLPNDSRLTELRNLNGYFPFQSVAEDRAWTIRQANIRRRILISQGLWPMPTRSALNAVIHGRVERDDYVVDRVYFESIPGHFVTGSLYRPKEKQGPFPAILSPHGHWSEGRFYSASDNQVQNDLASGAERFESSARFPIQARAVQLARMGCLVFVYDMTGNADSIQIGHRPDKADHLDRATEWGFFSAQAELRLQNMMGLQTWNSIRAIDFLLDLDDVDSNRIGVTGASGGGTQSMILGAIDDRVAAVMPCVMVSTSMQGGCTCENAPYLRIDQGNIDIAAAIAPRPLGMTAADDWTIELKTKGYPDLKQLYAMLGHPDRLTAAFHTQFEHNYNHVNRAVMYGFFNRHFKLGFKEPVLESDFAPLTRSEATVWTDNHSAPSGDVLGDAHEVRMLQIAAKDSAEHVKNLLPRSANDVTEFDNILGGAWETILGRNLQQVGEVNWTRTDQMNVDGISITLGLLDHAGEQLPTAQINPAGSNGTGAKGTVVWINDHGKQHVVDANKIDATAAELARNGYRVLAVDLIGQGEFLSSEVSPIKQSMWYQNNAERAWQRFSGYTYGYNHPLFVKRVHDVLTTIRYATERDATERGSAVHVVGIGAQAGAIAIAARSQSGDSVERTFVDFGGFSFDSLTQQDDPMFVPGAVKYLGVDGLISLCLPGQIDVCGGPFPIAEKVATAIAASASIRQHRSNDDLRAAIGASLP